MSLAGRCHSKFSNKPGSQGSTNIPVSSVKPSPELFDGQAQVFDQRAGLPPEHCRHIAAAVLELGDVGAAELIVEAGAGTGQIGAWLAASRRYLGFDLSKGMLQRFRARLGGLAPKHVLLRADANRGWPLASGAARAIFGSRALHLLDHEHVADEVFRVATPTGATLIIGRVERAHESVRARMAGEMRGLLRRHGVEARGDQQDRRLIEACVRRGAVMLEPVTAATWPVTASARQSLDAWRQNPGLGGVDVPDETRQAVLDELEAWAAEVFGGLDQPCESQEAYVLKPLRLWAAE